MRFFKLLTVYITVFSVAVTAFTAPAFSQVVTKTTTSIPPGVDIFPGSQVEVTIRVPGGTQILRNPADTMLVMDRTGSMGWRWDGLGPCQPGDCKMDSAKTALNAFVGQSKEGFDNVGLVSYAAGCGNSGVNNFSGCLSTTVCNPLTNCATNNFTIADMTAGNKTAIETAINGIAASGATSIGAGMSRANSELIGNKRADVDQYMILAADGQQNTIPSPYQDNILQTAIDNHITVFTIGIGNDVIGTSSLPMTQGGNNYCQGCPDIPSIGGQQTSGEMIMKDIACRTDQNRSDPADNCILTWNTSNSNSINDLDRPAHYFFAPSDAGLTLIYQQIANEIAGDYWYQIIDSINQNVFTAIVPGSFTVTDCATGANWPVSNQLVAGQTFIVLLEAVPAGKTVCIRFRAGVRNDPAFLASLGTGNWYPADSFGIAAVWPEEYGSCDTMPPFGSLNIIEIMQCWGKMQQLPLVDIPFGQFYVVNPADPWLKTTGGDVGSKGKIEPRYDPPGDADNTDYLAISNHTTISKFFSARGWLVKEYFSDYGGINVRPATVVDPATGKPSIYLAFTQKYKPDINRNWGTKSLSDIPSTGGFWFVDGGLDHKKAFSYTGKPAIIFVNGTFNIDKDLDLSLGTDVGLIFIIRGDVDIKHSVTRFDGVLVFDGYIDTKNSTTKLTINGSVIGAFDGDLRLNRDFRSALNNTEPVELFMYEPKYLWLFRDLLGDKITTFKEAAP